MIPGKGFPVLLIQLRINVLELCTAFSSLFWFFRLCSKSSPFETMGSAYITQTRQLHIIRWAQCMSTINSRKWVSEQSQTSDRRSYASLGQKVHFEHTHIMWLERMQWNSHVLLCLLLVQNMQPFANIFAIRFWQYTKVCNQHSKFTFKQCLKVNLLG